MAIEFRGEPVIGIDMGTTTVCAGFFDGKKVHILSSQLGQALTPSYYAVTQQNKVLVGQAAKSQAVMNPEGTVTAFKRLMGLRYGSPKALSVQRQVSYELTSSNNGYSFAKLQGRAVSPVEMAACILREVKESASAIIGQPVTKALVTVPADYNEEQRQATTMAIGMAGLKVIRLLNEPTAAALAYCAGKPDSKRTLAIYDLGGGTFDVTIMAIDGPVFEVLNSGGDLFLGGEDFDNQIVEFLLQEVRTKHSIDLSANRAAVARIKQAAEVAKIGLSSNLVVNVELPYLHVSPDGKVINFMMSLPRTTLNRLAQPLIARTIAVCAEAVRASGKSIPQIDDVLLIGGMSRMPAVQQAVTSLFGRTPVKGIHPEEAVSMGAARHAYDLTTGSSSKVLLDILPHSLSLVAGSMAIPILKKGATLPAKRQQTFNTTQEGQASFLLKVVQGESADPAKNTLMGMYSVAGIPPKPRGEAQLKIDFSVDASGSLSITAVEGTSGKVLKVTAAEKMA